MKNGAPFSGMIVGSVELIRRKAFAVSVAVVSFALLAAVSSEFLRGKIDVIQTTLATHFNLSQDEFDKLVQSEMDRLGTLSFNQFMAEIESRGGSPTITSGSTVTRDQLGITYVARVGPYVGLMILIDMIVAFIAFVFFLILFSRGSVSAYEAAALLPKQVILQVALVLWIFIRSLFWIPLLGPVIAIYFMPKMSLAPVILASGEAGVLQSITMSLQRTSHQWFTVFLRNIGLFIVLILMLWPCLVLVALVGLFSFKLSFILWLCLLMAEVVFFCAAQTMLAVMFA